MKGILLTLAVLIGGFVSMCAQETEALKPAIGQEPVQSPKHNFQSLELGAGYYSFPQISYILYAKDKERKLYTAPTPSFSGPFNLAFSGFVTKEWEINISFGMDKIQGRLEKTLYDLDSNGNVTDTIDGFSNYSSKVLTLLICGRYHWKQQKMIDMYSGFGAGIAFISNDSYGQISTGKNLNTYIGAGFQLTFIGIRVGKKFGGFAEAGFGSQGAIHGGVSVRF